MLAVCSCTIMPLFAGIYRRGSGIGLIMALLLAGMLQIAPLSGAWAELPLPLAGVERLQQSLDRLVPYDASLGEEGVSVQGALLIVMLGLIAATAWRGLGRVDEGYNRWTRAAWG